MISIPNRLLTLSIATIFALAAIFWGGNFPFGQGLLLIAAAFILGVTAFLPSHNLTQPSGKWLLLGVVVPASLTLVWSLCQLTTLLPANPYWMLTPSPAPWLAVTLNPGLTIAHLAYATGLGLFAYGVFRFAQATPSLLVKITAATCTLAAAYGLIMFAVGAEFVLWLPKTAYLGSLTGTFINRNSFATFLGLGILANLAVTLGRVGEISSRLNTRQRLRAFWYLIIRPKWPWLCAALVCLVALVLTNSRAGIACSLIGVLVLFGSLATMRPAVRLPLGGIIALTILITFIIFASLGGELGKRLGNVAEDSSRRQLMLNYSYDIIQQSPLTGTGLGTYATAFSTVRNSELLGEMPTATEHAHNTYIELTTELGLPAMALIALGVFSLIAAFTNGLQTRRRAIVWPALGMASTALIGGHALFDFSLSIPAVALATLVLLMVALAQSLPAKLPETPTQAPLWKKSLILLPAILLGTFGLWQTTANFYSLKAGGTVYALINGTQASLADIKSANAALETCLKINPYHPTCAQDLAQTTLGLATANGLTGTLRGVALIQLNLAREQYLHALTLNPVNPLAWYRVARIEAYLSGPKAAAAPLVNSLITGPAEPTLATLRVPLMLAVMPYLSPDDTNLFTNNIRGLWYSTPRKVAEQLLLNPAVHPAMAKLIANDPEAVKNWPKYMSLPFPATQQLGESPEKR